MRSDAEQEKVNQSLRSSRDEETFCRHAEWIRSRDTRAEIRVSAADTPLCTRQTPCNETGVEPSVHKGEATREPIARKSVHGVAKAAMTTASSKALPR
eukprot:6190675-Pleurochrysis_carterae.AAC.1